MPGICEPATNQPIAIDSNGDGTKDSSTALQPSQAATAWSWIMSEMEQEMTFHGTNSINGSMHYSLAYRLWHDNDLVDFETRTITQYEQAVA